VAGPGVSAHVCGRLLAWVARAELQALRAPSCPAVQLELERVEKDAARKGVKLSEEALAAEKRLVEALRCGARMLWDVWDALGCLGCSGTARS
jgi:hypothetical protein